MKEQNFSGISNSPLTVKECQNARPMEKPYRLSDRQGLYLEVRPSGHKAWKFDYRFEGRILTKTYGTFPELSLKEARDRHIIAKGELAQGINPRHEEIERQKKQNLANLSPRTWRDVCLAWLETRLNDKAASTQKTYRMRLQHFFVDDLGDKPFTDITFEDLKSIVRHLEDQKMYASSQTCISLLKRIYRYAKAERWVEENLAEDLQEIVKARPASDKKNFPAIVDTNGVREMLLKIDVYAASRRCTPWVGALLKLAPLVALRAQELVLTKWVDVDLDKAIWTIPAERTKTRKEHKVYLSSQAKGILQDLIDRNLRENEFVFFSRKSKTGHLNSMGLTPCLERAGITDHTMCHHGWRSVLSTLAHEALAPHILIEKALAHSVGSAVVQAYSRGTYEAQLRIFYQWWADYLDALRLGEVKMWAGASC